MVENSSGGLTKESGFGSQPGLAQLSKKSLGTRKRSNNKSPLDIHDYTSLQQQPAHEPDLTKFKNQMMNQSSSQRLELEHAPANLTPVPVIQQNIQERPSALERDPTQQGWGDNNNSSLIQARRQTNPRAARKEQVSKKRSASKKGKNVFQMPDTCYNDTYNSNQKNSSSNRKPRSKKRKASVEQSPQSAEISQNTPGVRSN